jgi:hypothetical protein
LFHPIWTGRQYVVLCISISNWLAGGCILSSYIDRLVICGVMYFHLKLTGWKVHYPISNGPASEGYISAAWCMHCSILNGPAGHIFISISNGPAGLTIISLSNEPAGLMHLPPSQMDWPVNRGALALSYSVWQMEQAKQEWIG